MSGHLTKDRLLSLFARMNDKLETAGQRGEVYIVGGAVMALAHDVNRITHDVDSWIREGRDVVMAAARAVAQEDGDLGDYWLNEAVTMRHLPERADQEERPLYEGSHLTITGASRERMIALKLDAGREPDLKDVALLLTEEGVETRADANRLYAICYGTKEMPEESRQYLIDRYTMNVAPPAPRPAPLAPGDWYGSGPTGQER